jgi:uncharacterized protein (TIGR00730 family)
VPEFRSKDTWTIFRIMAEFVEGFETLGAVWPAVSIFGGARVQRCDDAYRLGTEIAHRLGREGFAIITGGGPGVMEAANRGAHNAGVPSIGLNIKLPNEQDANGYADTTIQFDYFFARKVMFVKYSCAVVMLPGGFGTCDELFECLTLKQTQKMKDIPVILVGSEGAPPRPARREGPRAVPRGRPARGGRRAGHRGLAAHAARPYPAVRGVARPSRAKLRGKWALQALGLRAACY